MGSTSVGKTKALSSFFLAILLVTTGVPIPAFAQERTAENLTVIQASREASKEELEDGNTENFDFGTGSESDFDTDPGIDPGSESDSGSEGELTPGSGEEPDPEGEPASEEGEDPTSEPGSETEDPTPESDSEVEEPTEPGATELESTPEPTEPDPAVEAQVAPLPAPKSAIKPKTKVVPKAAAKPKAKAAPKATYPDYSGFYTISTIINKSKVVDIAGASLANGTGAQLYSNNNSPAQRFTVEQMKNGYYYLRNVNSGKVLSVAGAAKKAGTPVIQWNAYGGAEQLWRPKSAGGGAYYFVSRLSSRLVLDVSGARAYNGAGMQIWTSNKTNAQKFFLNKRSGKTIAPGYYRVTSRLSSKSSLDIAGASNHNGGNAQIYASNSTLAQKFQLVYNSKTGYYTIKSAYSARVLDVAGGSNKNGANVQQWGSNGTSAQKWTISKSKGSYVIRSACSNKVLEANASRARNGANVRQNTYRGTSRQLWNFTGVSLVGNGIYIVKSALGKVLDVKNGRQTNNAALQTYTSNGTLAQKYRVARVSGNYYRIECLNSGRVLHVSGTKVVLYGYSGASAQLWTPLIAGGGQFYWRNRATGKVLDVAGGRSSNGAGIQVYKRNNTTAQKWAFSSTRLLADGVYVFSSGLDGGQVIDIKGAATYSGAPAQLYENNDTYAQKFWLSWEASGNIYRITNLNSGKSLDVATETFNATARTGLVQQWESWDGSKGQLWKLVYAGAGRFYFVSQLGNKNARLGVSGSSAANETRLGVYPAYNNARQQFKPLPVNLKGTTSYLQMPITLNQMTNYQDPYSSGTTSELKRMLNPKTWVPGQREYYQFADLRGYSGMTAAQLNSYIASTPNGRSGVLYKQGAAIVAAAKKYNINEVYLLTHAILESAWGTSEYAQRAYYQGRRVYNLFGYGAYDSNPDNAIAYAWNQGWTTVKKALDGAAQLISTNYIYRLNYEQQTLYMMKWDLMYTYRAGGRGWHQYATGITWAESIGRLMGSCYFHNNMSPSLHYIVPRYR